jgi:hypothetical protein
MDTASERVWFRADDVLDPQSIVGRLTALFDLRTSRQLRNTLLLMAVPFGLLSAAALHDGRFYFKSLATVIEPYGKVLGMSFLGDTMVWPFCIVVPLAIALTAKAARSTTRSLNHLADIMDKAVGDRVSIEGVVQNTVEILAGGKNSVRLLVLGAPWIIAITFNLYNGLTCFFRPQLAHLPEQVLELLPDLRDPYASNHIFVLDESAKPDPVYKLETVDERVSIPKWDTDRNEAFASTVIMRGWTLFFYSVMPFLIVRLFLMVCAFAYFLRIFGRWVRESHSFKLEEPIISPFSSGSFGGLDYLSQTAMSMFYVVLCFVLMAGLAFLKEGISPSFHNYLAMLIFLPAGATVFVVPMLYARDILKATKVKYLSFIGDQQNELLFELTTNRYQGREFNDAYYKFLSLKAYRDEITKLSVWPFSQLTVVKMVGLLFSVPTITGILSAVKAVRNWFGLI